MEVEVQEREGRGRGRKGRKGKGKDEREKSRKEEGGRREMFFTLIKSKNKFNLYFLLNF